MEAGREGREGPNRLIKGEEGEETQCQSQWVGKKNKTVDCVNMHALLSLFLAQTDKAVFVGD